jgi:hypothetical protein
MGPIKQSFSWQSWLIIKLSRKTPLDGGSYFKWVQFTLVSLGQCQKVYAHMQVDVVNFSLLSGILYCSAGMSGARNVTIPSHSGVIVMSNILGNLAAVMYVRSSEPNTRNDLLDRGYCYISASILRSINVLQTTSTDVPKLYNLHPP